MLPRLVMIASKLPWSLYWCDYVGFAESRDAAMGLRRRQQLGGDNEAALKPDLKER